MAFFKEKRTGSLNTTTAVNWGGLISESMDLSVLSNYLAEQQTQRRKDLENAPKMFDTTLVKLEPALRAEVDTLYEEYVSNINYIQGRPSNRSDVDAKRKRNSEILKHISQYELGIQNLENNEKLYDEDYTQFLPTSYNNYDGGTRGLKLHNAYIDLIDGSWKQGTSDVVEDVIPQGGKVMVKIVGEDELIDANDLSPFPQPSAQVKTGVFDPLAGLGALSIQENGDVLATESLDDIFNSVTNMKFNDIRGVLNYDIPLSRTDLRSKFGGKSSISAMDDEDYLNIYKKYIGGDGTEKNWKGFYDAGTREENGMTFKTNEETGQQYTQYELNEELKNFTQDWVQKTGQQIIDAGAAFRPVDKEDNRIPIFGGVTAENRVQRIEGGIDFIEEIHEITKTKTESPLGTDAYKDLFLENLVNRLDQITTDGEWDASRRYTSIEEAEQDALNNLTSEQLILALQKDGTAIDEDEDEALLNAISVPDTKNLTEKQLKPIMKSLFIFKDEAGKEHDLEDLVVGGSRYDKDNITGKLTPVRTNLFRDLLPNEDIDLNKYKFEAIYEGKYLKGFTKEFDELMAQTKSEFVPNVRNGIFRNVLSRGMIGVGSADLIVKHIDKNDLITYHAIDIFRGDVNFTANEDSGIRLSETTHIDPDVLLKRGITRYSTKYKKGGVND